MTTYRCYSPSKSSSPPGTPLRRRPGPPLVANKTNRPTATTRGGAAGREPPNETRKTERALRLRRRRRRVRLRVLLLLLEVLHALVDVVDLVAQLVQAVGRPGRAVLHLL